MVTCSRCGQSNEATSRFCVACGTRLAATQSDAQPSYAHAVPPAATGAPYAAAGTAAPGAAAPPGAPHYAPTQASVAYAPPAQPPGAQQYAAQSPYAAQPSHAAQSPYGAQPYGAQPSPASPYGAQPSYGAQPYAAQPQGAQSYGVQPGPPPSAAPYGVPSGVASPAAAAAPGFVQPFPAASPAPPLSGVPYEAPKGPFTQPSAGLAQGQPPASYGVAAPNVAAPAEPVRAKPSNAPAARLEFAETAPPLLGEDVLNRRIQDRGAQRRAGSAAGNEEAPKATQQPSLQREPLSVPSDAPRVLTGFLVSYEGSPLGQSWVVHQGTNLVGRSGAVAGADIELPHATVSSRHALLTASAHPGRITITDFASTNGSFVNDTALVAHEARELRDGDRIRFGLLTAIVKII